MERPATHIPVAGDGGATLSSTLRLDAERSWRCWSSSAINPVHIHSIGVMSLVAAVVVGVVARAAAFATCLRRSFEDNVG